MPIQVAPYGKRGPAALAAYYGSPDVRARIGEYCGGDLDQPESLTAVSLAGYGGARRLHSAEGAVVPFPLDAWRELMDDGADVCRSLADRAGTLLLLDVDYVNHDDPAEPYREADRTFDRLEPVYRAISAAFARRGVRPLVLLTGRGYHFVVKAASGMPLHASLAGVGGFAPELPLGAYRAEPRGATLLESACAHEGAGRVLEHLAHEVLRTVAGHTELPVTLLDMAPPGGGPFVCVDLTAYADPLLARNTRCAFASSQKPLSKGLDVDPGYVFALPRGDEPLSDLLRARGDPERAREMAAGADVRIPVAVGAAEWMAAYLDSALAGFHRYFDAGPEVDRAGWPATYDTLDLRTLPACAAFPLAYPNPALLTPGWLRTVALALWALGWHPRSIAGLVWSRYEHPHGWGDYWNRYDARSRARFYVRVSCGAIATGLEDRAAFTCRSQAAGGLCPAAGCGVELQRLCDAPQPPRRGSA